MKELTNKQKEEIDFAVSERLDDLEDFINEQLKGILGEMELEDNQEALVFAREIFFRG